ncbi:MAG: polysaccharide deacetylase family protein [Gemmataceae bacterium]
MNKTIDRRKWMASMAACAISPTLRAGTTPPPKAQIAITLDLEMSRNFPTRDSTHWDYEKGNLNEETKRYSVEAAKIVKQSGGRIHFFAVGRVFEQPDITWLKTIVEDGHPVGNHTYDHINLTASRVEDLQFRFQRAPWLLRGQSLQDAIRENIQITNAAMKSRLGIKPAGFRTPGGFNNGLRDHEGSRAILKELGFEWISSLYPAHPYTMAKQKPDAKVVDGILAALPKAQPFRYPDGILEIPMSPISDIGAFRTGQWNLEWYLDTLKACLEKTIDQGLVFDFLAHPSCLYVVDPEFKAIRLICELAIRHASKAKLTDLNQIAAMS